MSRYKKALSYLESFVNYENELPGKYDENSYSLLRIEKLLGCLGNPHHSFKSIHIAGTNGKGSTGAMLMSILREAGFKSGFYSSPHLISFRERIRIGDELIPEEKVCNLIDFIKPAVEKLESCRSLKPSFFEVYTALAFLYFAHEKVDFAVIETGLGGRLDATNVIKPVLSIITRIDIDHSRQLGKTRVSVTREKAGIIKNNVPLLTCSQEKDVFKVIKEKCMETNSPLTEVSLYRDGTENGFPAGCHDIVFVKRNQSTIKGNRFSVHWKKHYHDNLTIPLIGEHQVINAGIAAAGAGLLGIRSVSIRRGLELTKWEGRLQLFSCKPPVLLDGAHNPAAARALAGAIKSIFGNYEVILVLGISSDKDIKGIVKELIPVSKKVILTKADSPRAEDPARLKCELGALADSAKITSSSNDALKLAFKESPEGSLICVTGSFFLVGEILKWLTQNCHSPA